jgi:anthranilate synthase component 1
MMQMPSISRDDCVRLVQAARAEGVARGERAMTFAVPVALTLIADQLTPVLAYRRLVTEDERTAPSFLLESVEGGERQGRYSILGAQPRTLVTAFADQVTVRRMVEGSERAIHSTVANPLEVLREVTGRTRLIGADAASLRMYGLPECVLGGWLGYAGYDSVRYVEPEKLGFSAAPKDDRRLPDLCFGFYDGVVVFDHVGKTVILVQLAMVAPGEDAGAAYERAVEVLRERAEQIEEHTDPLRSGVLSPQKRPAAELKSNLTKQQHADMVAKAKEYIRAGDIFQVVLGQRFERVSAVDPFDVYRALRTVNPSPYMVYMQCEGCILVGSSPEILCRVRVGPDGSKTVTNRPLAGTRRRGETRERDLQLEQELLADAKERAEHIMLVDLGRNDVGVVSEPGSITLPSVMEVERYSHVMHISSTVTGSLREGLDCFDALRAALPVGTISGAPKIRAMQVIDELEPIRRGPYGGGMGYVGLDGSMDIALTLRTIVTPTTLWRDDQWTYHLQASGGIVADSVVEDEYQETVNKSAALARAIDVAEAAFLNRAD